MGLCPVWNVVSWLVPWLVVGLFSGFTRLPIRLEWSARPEPRGSEVHRASASDDVGEDPGLASASGFASTPRPPGEVGDLAFDGWAVAQ
jgi:hypothetical protein